jgi:hypothetical protein
MCLQHACTRWCFFFQLAFVDLKITLYNSDLGKCRGISTASTNHSVGSTSSPRRGTLELEEFEYSFESWRQTPEIAGG